LGRLRQAPFRSSATWAPPDRHGRFSGDRHPAVWSGRAPPGATLGGLSERSVACRSHAERCGAGVCNCV